MITSDLKQIGDLIDKKLEKQFELKLKPINRKLDALTTDVTSLQRKSRVWDEIYKNTKNTQNKVNELDQRVGKIETALDLQAAS
ncbi:MAG TPA: hypothetical protein VIK81_04765 [Patescibacteria group bacterium]